MLIGVVAVCVVAFTGYQALQARSALQEAAADFEAIGVHLTSGDTQAARASLESAQSATDDAKSNTRGPGWWVGQFLPGIGDDVSAVRTVADVADELATQVLPPAVEASQTLSPQSLRPRNGRIDLDPIIDAEPVVADANVAMQTQAARVADIETGGLVEQLRGPVRELGSKVENAAELTDKAALAARLLPRMLGAQDKRTYLFLFQNNAEIRATGGIPGSLATVTADNGKIEMVQQGAAKDLGSYTKPALPLTAQERALFETKMGIFPADSNFTPDFPRTGQLVRAMWQRAQGQTVDGVVSVDPIALSHLLEGTGPVAIPSAGQQLTAGNVVQSVLNDIYLNQPDTEAQNIYFEQVAGRVFDAVSAGQGDPVTVLEGLAQSAKERRLLLWSADRTEQRLLAPTQLSGALPDGTSTDPQVGVYYNDATGAKMHYYFHDDVSVESTGCQDGQQDLRITVQMRSTAPPNAAQLPVSVTGSGYYGTPPGVIRTTALVYLPSGARLDEALIDGEDSAVAELEHEGRPVVATTVDLEPGQKRRLTYDVVTGEDQSGDPELRVTPGVHGSGVGVVSESSC